MQPELIKTLNKALLYFEGLDSGFVIIEVNEYHLQKHAVEYITDHVSEKQTLVLDLKNLPPDTTHLDFVRKNAVENQNVSVFLILNLHTLAKKIRTGEVGLVRDLNFSREPYAGLNKILVFFCPLFC